MTTRFALSALLTVFMLSRCSEGQVDSTGEVFDQLRDGFPLSPDVAQSDGGASIDDAVLTLEELEQLERGDDERRFTIATGPVIDTIFATEDPKATGYTDNRKTVRDNGYTGKRWAATRKKDGSGKYRIYVYERGYNSWDTWTATSWGNPLDASPVCADQRVPSLTMYNGVLHITWYGNYTAGGCETADAGNGNHQVWYAAYQVKSPAGWIKQPAIIQVVSGYSSGEYWQEHPTIHVDGWETAWVTWQGKDVEAGNPDTADMHVKVSKRDDHDSTFTDWHTWTVNSKKWRNVDPTGRTTSRPTVMSWGGHIYLLAYRGYTTSEDCGSDPCQQIVWIVSEDSSRGDEWGSNHSTYDNDTWAAIRTDPTLCTLKGHSTNCIEDQRHVSAVMQTNGTLHAVWREIEWFTNTNTWGTAAIMYSTKPWGQAWTDPVIVAEGTTNGTRPTYPTITDDRNGSLGHYSIHALWVEPTHFTDGNEWPSEHPAYGDIKGSEKTYTGGWQTPGIIIYDYGTYPVLRKFDPTGYIDFVYTWNPNADSMGSCTGCQVRSWLVPGFP